MPQCYPGEQCTSGGQKNTSRQLRTPPSTKGSINTVPQWERLHLLHRAVSSYYAAVHCSVGSFSGDSKPREPSLKSVHDPNSISNFTSGPSPSFSNRSIISRTEESHTHLEWLRFLKQIDRETPKELDLHLIVDNYATHKHPVVQHWLSRHPRFHTHFTPTSSSWLNLVERFFGELTSEVVREGSFQSLRHLVRAIEFYLVACNANPKKYVWRASSLEILEKIKRAREALATADVIST